MKATAKVFINYLWPRELEFATHSMRIADVPGFEGSDGFQDVTSQVKKALTQKGRYKLGFVFTPVGGVSGGRVNSFEVISAKQVLKALPADIPYFIVVNRFSKDFDEEAWQERLNRYLCKQSGNFKARLPQGYFFMPFLGRNIEEETIAFREFILRMDSSAINEISEITEFDGRVRGELFKMIKEEEKQPLIEPAKKNEPPKKEEGLKKVSSSSCCCLPWFSK